MSNLYNSQISVKNGETSVNITDREKAEFEIKGVSSELTDRFSSRRKEVLAKVAQLEAKNAMPHLNGTKLHEAAALATRRAKTPVTENQLKTHFKDIFKQAGMSEKDLVKSVEQQRCSLNLQGEQRSVNQTVLDACVVCTEHESVFFKSDILGQAAKIAHSSFSLKQYETGFNDLEQKGALVPLGAFEGQEVFTTSEMQTIEKQIPAMINLSAGQYKSGINEHNINKAVHDYETKKGFHLTDDQKKMIDLLNNKDGVNIVQGDAGTGKTSSMQVISDICQKNNMTCAGIAPTGKAVQEMKADGIQDSMTIASFLNKINRPDLKLPDVLITDEISMAGSRDIYQILSAVDNKTKLIFTGDKKQLPSISAGRVHDIIQKQTCVKKVEMKQLLRQRRGSNAQKVMAAFTTAEKDREKNPVTEALKQMQRQGNIHQISLAKDRIKEITDYAAQKIAKGKSVAVLCNTVVSKDKINQSIRSQLINCIFRSIPSTHSGAFRPLIPIDSVHPFRSIPSGSV
jgi:hypothetical protein